MRSTLALLCLGWFATIAVAQDFTAPVLGRKISVKPLLDLAKLADRDLVDELRKAGLKVLVVEAKAKDAVVTDFLKDKNLKEDAEALKFYNDKRTGPLHLVKGSLAMFLAPYSRVQEGVIDGREFLDRPYQESPVIVIYVSGSRYELYHEFVHFLLWQAKKNDPVTVGKKKVCTTTMLKVERMALYPELKKLTNAVREERDKDKLAALELRHARTVIQIIRLQQEFEKLAWGEELDVNRAIMDNAEALKLSKDERRGAALYFQESSQRLARTMDAHRSILSKADFQRKLVTSEDDKKRLKALLEIVNDNNDRYNTAADWFNEAIKTLK